MMTNTSILYLNRPLIQFITPQILVDNAFIIVFTRLDLLRSSSLFKVRVISELIDPVQPINRLVFEPLLIT